MRIRIRNYTYAYTNKRSVLRRQSRDIQIEIQKGRCTANTDSMV